MTPKAQMDKEVQAALKRQLFYWWEDLGANSKRYWEFNSRADLAPAKEGVD